MKKALEDERRRAGAADDDGVGSESVRRRKGKKQKGGSRQRRKSKNATRKRKKSKKKARKKSGELGTIMSGEVLDAFDLPQEEEEEDEDKELEPPHASPTRRPAPRRHSVGTGSGSFHVPHASARGRARQGTLRQLDLQDDVAALAAAGQQRHSIGHRPAGRAANGGIPTHEVLVRHTSRSSTITS